jgi:hypothetical protein
VLATPGLGGVDAARLLAQHEGVMGTAVYARERRSSRVFMRVRVVVAGKNKNRKRFREACETIVINAHGGLLYFSQSVEMGAMLVLTNPFTQEEQECRVVFLGEESDKAQLVGIEFLTPAPRFWGVEFAQPDWHNPTPSPAPVNSQQN